MKRGKKVEKKVTTFGVYPHAQWRIVSHADGGGVVVLTDGGYVVREVTPAVPYGRMTPVRTYKSRVLAQKHADKLNA